MSEEPAVPPDVDDVVTRLQARVEERRRSGAYPPGLEERLDDHFRRIVAHRASRDLDDVRARMADLDERARFDAGQIHAESHVPGGQALHRAVSRVVARQTKGILDQVQRYADGVREVLVGVVAALDDPGHVHPDLIELLDAVLERLAAAERRATVAEAALAGLTRRVAQLEASSTPAR